MDWQISGLLLFACLVVTIMIGIPVAFALGLTGAIFSYFFLGPSSLIQLGRISFEIASTHLFIVVPLFVLMAGLISQSDVAEKSFTAATKWLNWMPGSLAASTVASATLFSAISGSSPATAAAVGYTAIPEMLRNGYNKRLSAGVVAAGGTLGVLIPPSVVMIIFGIITETSIGKLFIAGIIPGIVFSLMLTLHVVIYSKIYPPEGDRLRSVSWADRFGSLTGIWPVILLFVVIIGSIYTGIATATEAAAVGAVAALLLTLPRGGMGWKGLNSTLRRTAHTTAMVMLLIICGSFFGFVVAALGIAHGVVEMIMAAQLSPWTVLVSYLVILLILGCLMDPASIMVVTLPLAFPVLKQLGFDPIWIGVLVTITVEIGLITPPMGINLFVLQGIAPDRVSALDIMMGALPFVGTLLAGLLLVLLIPELATWLPSQM